MGGLLAGFIPRLNLSGTGITVEAIAALSLEQGRLNDVVRHLTRKLNVLEVHATTGRADLLVRLATTSHAELQDLIQEIVSIPGVAYSDTSLALTTPVRYRIQPLLEQITREAGFGRSTPLPMNE